MTIAVYPGSFDPITNGHIDVATRAARIFDRVIIGIYDNPGKQLMFALEERVDMAVKAVAGIRNIEAIPFTGLAVDFASRVKAGVMVRGLRVSADFEHEFDMAMMNKKLNPELELVCLMASPEYQFLSSSILKEVARLGGNIDDLVPGHVAEALRKKEGA
ncbi:MAG TPA: pantetheine-phosphate adenylyltransferase [Dehalococcoidia bacterium]|nr:pantetheine-phosphate adenylyltransferase [Dehalococcoidia bacterium]